MFIHFTFGSLAKENRIEEQTEKVIELILEKRRLKPSPCPEFMPAYPTPGIKMIPGDLKVEGNKVILGEIKLGEPTKLLRIPAEKAITYLPVDVNMICFIRISFSQLPSSGIHEYYGKFGIVLTNNFLKKRGIKPVEYYTEESVWTNPLIKRWNHYTRNNLYPEKHKELQDEIVSCRKPATLFPSFLRLTTIEIKRTQGGLTAKHYTYNRYPEGYDFTKEKEYRLVFNEGSGALLFNESDLYMVITPDSKAKGRVEKYLKESWSYQPRVSIFPT